MSLTLLKDKILPAAFNKDGSKFVDCELDLESTGEDQFQSNVVFLTAVVQNGETKKIPLVIKFEPFNLEVRKLLNSGIQFYNEILMYNEVLPFLNKNEIIDSSFPTMYFGAVAANDSEHGSVVVLQDLRPVGYKLTDVKVFLDYEHISLAISKLGRFHALSYAAKKTSPDKFYKLAQNLREPAWTDTNSFYPVLISCFHRAMDPLIKQSRHVQLLRSILECIEGENGFTKFMRNLVATEEPLAVVCHGDFCRNNMLFKYGVNGKPINVKFFDIATARYSSPIVDIAFFLFLNSSREFRKAHLDDLLMLYHSTLSSAIPGTEVPSLDAIRNEFKRKAFYGFVHCSFFLPMMLYENSVQCVDMADMSEEELSKTHVDIGGEAGTKLMSDMVEELIQEGCLSMQHTFWSHHN